MAYDCAKSLCLARVLPRRGFGSVLMQRGRRRGDSVFRLLRAFPWELEWRELFAGAPRGRETREAVEIRHVEKRLQFAFLRVSRRRRLCRQA